MKRWLISLGLVFAVPGLALPQTARIQAEIDKELHQTRLYEDIEIMRRLLQRRIFSFMNSCQKCHSTVAGESPAMDPLTSTATSPDGPGISGTAPGYAIEPRWESGIVGSGRVVWHPDGGGRGVRTGSSDSIALDGTYVPGQGVILQAQLPLWAATATREPRGNAQKKPAEAINDWDLIRKQIRGEKTEGRSTPADDPHEITIQDVLVRALAEYGKHMRLAQNERLTLTVTFRRAAAEEHAGSVRYSAAEALAGVGEAGSDRGAPPAGVGPGSSGGALSSAGGGPMGPQHPSGLPVGPPSSSRDYELLADLHIKQGRYQEAIKALRKAAEVYTDSNRHVSIYRKLASVQLLMNDPNQKTLDEVMELLQKAKASAKAGAVPAPRLYLPQRLTITASQPALLDASTNNLDAFRSQINLVWLRFDHAVPGGGGEGGAGSSGSGPKSK